jgi:O-acetyl-ADP-ribose deacetylase (regulator of RNase III)
MDQISELSEDLVNQKNGMHPSNVSLRRSTGQWKLISGWAHNYGTWQKTTTKAMITGGTQAPKWNRLLGNNPKTVEVTQFNKTGIGQGLIPLSKGKLTAFTRSDLSFIQQKAPPIGDTLRLAISEKGEVLLAIPNLEKGSVLAQAGVTAEDMENLTTTTAAIKLDKNKASALRKYWAAIATIADNHHLISSFVSLDSRKAPFFNISLQTHYPQHLRFTFTRTETFGPNNSYFDKGQQTTMLDTLASIYNKNLFPSPQPAVPHIQPATPVATAQSTSSVAQTLGIHVSCKGLEQIANIETVVIPSYPHPGLQGRAGRNYSASLSGREQNQLQKMMGALSQDQLVAFQKNGVLAIDFKNKNQSLVFVRSPQKPSDGSLRPLIQIYANLLNQLSTSKHIAVPLISTGGSMGFTIDESVEAAVLAMNSFKAKNPSSPLTMTLCNPAMPQNSLEELLTDATNSLKKLSVGETQRVQPAISLTGRGIHQVKADAWVNPSNTGLVCGGVVSQSIINALGGRSLTQNLSTCKEGSAVTNGKKLGPQQVMVIHVAGPAYDKNNIPKSSQLLYSTYVEAIKLADKNGCKSVAIPAISTGALGFPLDKATPIAFSAVREALRSCKNLTEVKFCYHGPKAEAVYTSELNK